MNIINKIFENKNGHKYRVNKFLYSNSKNRYYEIEFVKTGYIKNVTKSQIKRGYIKDPYMPSVANIGFIGELNQQATTKNKYYSVWLNMINRCYNSNSTEFQRYGKLGVKVCERWHNFTNFFNDIKLVEGYNEKDFSDGNLYLDKDIKQIKLPKNKRIYSLKTCLFTSASINSKNADYTNRTKRNSLKFKAINKEGKEYVTSNANKFEKEFKLATGSVSRCLNGKAKSAKGWRFYKIQEETVTTTENTSNKDGS